MSKRQRPSFLAGLLMSGSDTTARDIPTTSMNPLATLIYGVGAIGAVFGLFAVSQLGPVFLSMLAVCGYKLLLSRKAPGDQARSTTTIPTPSGWQDEGRGASNGSSALLRKEVRKRGQTPEQMRRRAELLHDSVLKRWRAYELDLALMIDFPAMADPRVAETSEMIQAMRAAEDLRDTEDIGAYTRAVREFERTFEVAEAHAQSLKRNSYTPAELKSLSKAAALLAIAQDSVSTPPERRLAYQRLVREVQGLLLLPDSATVALEKRIQLELEADR